MLLAVVAASPAVAGRFRVRSVPTPGLPGFSTYTFSIETSGEEAFRGLDARFDGPMNQVNPLGVSSVYNDANALFDFVGAVPEQDSQFSFNSSDVLALAPTESEGQLRAAISGLATLDLANPVDFAQVVTDSPTELTFEIDFDLGLADPVRVVGGCSLNGCGISVFPQDPKPDPDANAAKLFATGSPTPGMPGFQTYTLYAEVLGGAGLNGLSIDLSGPMNQVNPEGAVTVLNDANGLFAVLGADPLQDSQLLFGQDDLLSFAGLEESHRSLAGDMVFQPNLLHRDPIPLARVVTADASRVEFRTLLDVEGSTGVRRSGTLAELVIPEPGGTLLFASLFGLLAREPRG